MWCEATNEEQHLGFEEQLSVDESFKYTNLSCANMEVRYGMFGSPYDADLVCIAW